MDSTYISDGYYSSGVLYVPEVDSGVEGYRKFKLVNSLGDTYYMTEKNFKHFLNSPTGFGMRQSLSGSRVGNRYKITKRQFEMPSVNGELLFYSNRNGTIYDEYKEFINFCLYYPLKLYYYTPTNDSLEEEANSVYMICEVTTATKTEISSRDSCLHVPVTFQGLSFWLRGEETVYDVDLVNYDEGNFTFPLYMPFSFGSDPLSNLSLSNTGSIAAPVKIIINGTCKDPYIRFFREDATGSHEYSACRFIGDFTYIYVNAEDDKEELTLMNGSNILGNPAEYQDLSIGNPDDEDFYLTFMKLKSGISHGSVNLGRDFNGTVQLVWRDEFVSI